MAELKYVFQKTLNNKKEHKMAEIFEQMRQEIAKVQDKKQRNYLESVLVYESNSHINIETDDMLCAILPQKIGMTVGVEPSESEVWYQQYRTMKALIQKQQFTDTVEKVIELDDKEQLDKVFEIK